MVEVSCPKKRRYCRHRWKYYHAIKIAERAHSSTKEVIKNTLPYLQVSFKKNKDFRRDLINELDLSREEVEWLRK